MTTASLPAREGFVAFRGYRVWYRIVSAGESPGRVPLLTLHEGPARPTIASSRCRRSLPPVAAWSSTINSGAAAPTSRTIRRCGPPGQPHQVSVHSIDEVWVRCPICRDT